jgi:hypothetical protein
MAGERGKRSARSIIGQNGPVFYRVVPTIFGLSSRKLELNMFMSRKAQANYSPLSLTPVPD